MRASGLFSYGGPRERNDLGLDRHQEDTMVEDCGGAKMPVLRSRGSGWPRWRRFLELLRRIL
jgi:hypothetical protein